MHVTGVARHVTGVARQLRVVAELQLALLLADG